MANGSPPAVLCDATTSFPDATGANVVVGCHRLAGHPEDEHGHVAEYECEDDDGERWCTRVSWIRKQG